MGYPDMIYETAWVLVAWGSLGVVASVIDWRWRSR